MVALAYSVILKEVENRIFRHNRITHMYLWGYNILMQILHSYLRYTDRPLNMFSLLLAVILSGFHEKPRRKD